MTKQEFLDKLRDGLTGEVSSQEIQSNLQYYNQYFLDEMAQGKGEAQICMELGNPLLIARSIIDASESEGGADYQETIYTEDGAEASEQQQSSGFKVVQIKWYHKVLIAAVIILLLFLAFTVLKFLAPVILILIAISFFKRIFWS